MRDREQLALLLKRGEIGLVPGLFALHLGIEFVEQGLGRYQTEAEFEGGIKLHQELSGLDTIALAHQHPSNTRLAQAAGRRTSGVCTLP